MSKQGMKAISAPMAAKIIIDNTGGNGSMSGAYHRTVAQFCLYLAQGYCYGEFRSKIIDTDFIARENGYITSPQLTEYLKNVGASSATLSKADFKGVKEEVHPVIYSYIAAISRSNMGIPPQAIQRMNKKHAPYIEALGREGNLIDQKFMRDIFIKDAEHVPLFG